MENKLIDLITNLKINFQMIMNRSLSKEGIK